MDTPPNPLSFSPPKSKHPIPPSWYNLQTTNSHPSIALPHPAGTTSSDGPLRPPIFLTTFYPTDATALQAILSLPSINASLISVPNPYTLADAQFWVNLHSTHSTSSSTPSSPWLQALRTDDPSEAGPFIGAVSLTPTANSPHVLPDQSNAGLQGVNRDATGDESVEEKAGEQDQQPQQHQDDRDCYVLGYYLHPDYQRRGIMRDAVPALMAWAVAEKGVRRVRVDVLVENLASRAVVEGIEGFGRVAGEVEEVWPEGKGGGVKRLWSWVWNVNN